RLAHEGLAMVIALRLAANTPLTFTLQINDYGFELQSPTEIVLDIDQLKEVFSTEGLLDDILGSINAGEIAKRRFRDIARISGLVFDGYPGKGKSAKQVQSSSSLIFDVLVNYDKDNLLLDQARREVLELQLEFSRLRDTLDGLKQRRWHLMYPDRLTPLSFPLWAESVNSQTMSSESFKQRVENMLAELEQAASASLAEQSTADISNKQGSNKQGSNKQGSDKQGSDKQGSDKHGSDKQGGDKHGSDTRKRGSPV
ncbi:hypothetical protein OAM69_05495, partial [bacterium]|nr:hypothetical protein [bacterium]